MPIGMQLYICPKRSRLQDIMISCPSDTNNLQIFLSPHTR